VWIDFDSFESSDSNSSFEMFPDGFFLDSDDFDVFEEFLEVFSGTTIHVLMDPPSVVRSSG